MGETVYADIIRGHLADVFRGDTAILASYPGIRPTPDGFELTAFGQPCRISSQGVFIAGQPDWGPRGIIVGLLARHAVSDVCIETPWRAFRELPDSAPYVGAFRAHTEQILVPHVQKINTAKEKVFETLNGKDASDTAGCDFSFLVYPLPKIALCYIFYEADEDFSASATCLFSSNANQFMPIDGLADVAEYTSKAILDIVYE